MSRAREKYESERGEYGRSMGARGAREEHESEGSTRGARERGEHERSMRARGAREELESEGSARGVRGKHDREGSTRGA